MFHHFTNALSSEALGRPPALVAPGTRSDWQPPRRIPAPQDKGDERQDQASSDADGSSPPTTEGPNLIDAVLNFRPITSASKNPRGGPPLIITHSGKNLNGGRFFIAQSSTTSSGSFPPPVALPGIKPIHQQVARLDGEAQKKTVLRMNLEGQKAPTALSLSVIKPSGFRR